MMCSVKDRIARNMIERAEEQGRITPGKTTLVHLHMPVPRPTEATCRCCQINDQ